MFLHIPFAQRFSLGTPLNRVKVHLSFVAVRVAVKQEKTHHQKGEENHVNAHLKCLPKACQQFRLDPTPI